MIGIYLSVLALLIVDQLIKWWVVNQFALYTGQNVIDGIFSLFYLQNNGAAWGVLSGNMLFFYIVTIVFLAGAFYWFHQEKRHWIVNVAYIFIVAGALGNFIDRIRLGYVIDMFRFDFINFPVFNFADVCLTIGVIIFLMDSLFLEKKHATK